MKEKKSTNNHKKKASVLTRKEQAEVLDMLPSPRKIKDLTLNDIEEMEVDLITNTTNKNIFFNKQKLEMLDKLATQKLRRLQIEATIKVAQVEQAKPEPIKVEFVSANTVDNKSRIEQLEKEVASNLADPRNKA